MWQAAPSMPVDQHTLRHGPITLTVEPADGIAANTIWQYCRIGFGRHSTATTEECLVSWPRQAIELARLALDDLEAELCDTPQ